MANTTRDYQAELKMNHNDREKWAETVSFERGKTTAREFIDEVLEEIYTYELKMLKELGAPEIILNAKERILTRVQTKALKFQGSELMKTVVLESVRHRAKANWPFTDYLVINETHEFTFSFPYPICQPLTFKKIKR